MALAKRVIPCLDVDNGRVVKGVKFEGIHDAGDPVALAQRYSQQGADELVFLDITASNQGRGTMKEVVSNVAKVIDIPFTVGGGIRKLEDAREILLSGADKVSINTSAVSNPSLITSIMEIFGRQCTVVAMDVKRNYDTGKSDAIDFELARKKRHYFAESDGRRFWFEVRIFGGGKATGIDAVNWAKECERLGAGEILLTSIDADGTENGYDIMLTKAICQSVRIPVIASGGCGRAKHMLDVFREADVDAALAASIFHYDKSTVAKVKRYLKRSGVAIRL
ncbi:MAG: imidazole glycerol phosphate synthase subunit HisF [Nitrososphaera sp.]|jgi:cyclase